MLDDVELSADSNTDTIREVLAKGLPLLSTVMPVDHAAVFVRNAALDRFVDGHGLAGGGRRGMRRAGRPSQTGRGTAHRLVRLRLDTTA